MLALAVPLILLYLMAGLIALLNDRRRERIARNRELADSL
jgi:sec-independent protein translocase protein TatC